jgi:hypothetical protein
MRIERPLAVTALLAIPTFAWANVGWDWDEDFASRHWRTESLQWASDIREDHLSALDLVTYVAPPAHEMWCHSNIQPTQADFDIFHDRLGEWLHVYLDIPMNEQLPAMPPFPHECNQ